MIFILNSFIFKLKNSVTSVDYNAALSSRFRRYGFESRPDRKKVVHFACTTYLYYACSLCLYFVF